MSPDRPSSPRSQPQAGVPKDIFDRNDSAVMVFDERGNVVSANARSAALLDRSHTDVLESDLDRLLPTDTSFLGRICRQVLANRKPTTTFGWDTTLDHWIGVRIHPTRTGIEAHVRKIPSSTPPPDRGETPPADFAASLESVTEPMQIIDSGGIVRYANASALELLGHTNESYVGQPMQTFLLYPADLDEVLTAIGQGETASDHEVEFLLGSGEVRTIEIAMGDSRAAVDPDITECYLRDVTMERQQEEREARLAALVDASDDAIIAKRMDGIITSWNPGAERMYGYTADEAVGKPVTLIIPDDREDEFPEIMRQLAEGQHIDHYETVRQRKDGQRLDVSISIAPVRNKAGRIVGASTIARDITERRTLERKQSEFLTMVAHDLRSPLTSVKGFAQLMQRREAYSPSAIEAILSQVSHMERLVGDVLDITRIDEDRQDLALSDTDLREIASSIVTHARELRRTEHVRLVAPGDAPMVGSWDKARISQILDNLLSNALKYAPEGDITVSLDPHDTHVIIEVSDNGPGIDPEYVPYLFDRFFRAPGDHVMGRGVGLGLSITKALVEAHGGSIAVASTLGEGTTFSVRLPWKATAPVIVRNKLND